MNLLEEATFADLEQELAKRRTRMESISRKFLGSNNDIIEISVDSTDVIITKYYDSEDYDDGNGCESLEICHSDISKFITELQTFKGELGR